MNITSKILGESELEFSEQFKDVLALMRGIWDLSDQWWDHMTSPTLDKRTIKSVANLAYQHIKKYGRSKLTDGILSHIEGRVKIHDCLWNEIFVVMAIDAIEAINSGQLKPYSDVASILMGHSLGTSISKEKTPESLPIMQAMADAMDFEIDQLYDILED